MKLILLQNRRREVTATALVDDDLHEQLAEHQWHRDSRGYARRYVVEDGRKRVIFMHRAVLGLHQGDKREVDHLNRDPLDNRRENLRAVTRAENALNRGANLAAGSRFRGVYWQADRRKWRARVRYEGRPVHLGYYDDEGEAGRVVLDFLATRGVPLGSIRSF